uniref:Uncharacterized protein n=1 Tax=Peronospora matthiolae TaxID=2874970 RepID=A0AAV1TMZ5_9STRA
MSGKHGLIIAWSGQGRDDGQAANEVVKSTTTAMHALKDTMGKE